MSTVLFLIGCDTEVGNKSSDNGTDVSKSKLLTLLSPEHTNIHFNNRLPEFSEINILSYRYFYNGGGVAIGDINNDNLPDIYFTGNLVPNKLYLNKGNLQFEDITEKAGLEGKRGWTTGVTMVDINADGFLDIYVCRSGPFKEDQRANEFFINNGDLTFTDRAAEYGLDDKGYSTQAVFFDYDIDGDLDMYLLNHAIESDKSFYVKEIKSVRHPHAGDKLYRNDGGNFIEVSKEAGIYSNPIGFGLGVSIGDLNNDGLPDIYVANDFLEQDYLYFNNGDGTFTEKLKEKIKHTSLFSMGSDIADYNNDGWLDIVVLDMVAEDNYRKKTNMSGMNISQFQDAVDEGFHYQYMSNTLQMNNGNGIFSEVSQIAGISNTDWSWAPLFVDLDNDGYKDLFVTNGLKKDINNNDYLVQTKKHRKDLEDNLSLIGLMPSQKIKNYIYQNNGDLTFTNKTSEWGLNQPSFSNGASFADLDNDGDLDLVVNNIDENAFVYRNNSRNINKNHYLSVKLTGSKDNPDGIGARIEINSGNQMQVQEQYLTRGYQSSVGRRVHFGLGGNEKVEELIITWSDGRVQKFKNISADQTLNVRQSDATTILNEKGEDRAMLFTDHTKQSGVSYKHQENEYNDFELDSLLPHKMSNFGPGISVGDLNGDGLDDFFVGAAKGFAGKIYLQEHDGTFRESPSQVWKKDSRSEDVGAAFFDADNDGDLDLYVVSGGNEYERDAPELQDRLYLNDGSGRFRKTVGFLPKMLSSGSSVVPGDYDGDGDLDLFVGGRVVPGNYPSPPRSYILRNDEGKFTDVTEEIAADVMYAGLVTDAVWTDFNNDRQLDLILVGEWMPILMLENIDGKFSDVTNQAGLENSTGWWYSIASADFDDDGDTDYVVGNIGLNYKYKASVIEPFQVYYSDFDQNGTFDIVLGYYAGGELYPLRGRECSLGQMPFIESKFPSYKDFASATMIDVFGADDLNDALHYQAKTFATSYIENLGSGKFRLSALPNLAQLSSVNGILTGDINSDGNLDIVLAGNLYSTEVETPRNDASIGLYLKGDGEGHFNPVSFMESGFFADGDVKGLVMIDLGSAGDKGILVPKNDDYLQVIGIINKVKR
ncbi:MAG: VCBS repeat-containing protein [Candidatus Marinimicrobia bacterium]|nr:VCBS repeat-containing protein [Candidatus Neomarinimicrobiota bacterium]